MTSSQTFAVTRAASVAVAVLFFAQSAAAQEVSRPAESEAAESTSLGPRPITHPTVIKRPGSYFVARNFSLDGPGVAVAIAASGVSLDLRGHTLRGPGGKQGVGVRIAGVSGVRVFGGILSGFGTGVEVRDASNVRVEGLHVHGEDAGGPPPGEVGILIANSRAVFVERNVIARTFLGVFVRGGGSGGNRISENTVVGGAAGQIGICYNPDGSANPDGPTGDLVYNNLISRFNLGIQTSAGTAGNIFRENDVAYVQQAIQEVTPGSNVFEGNTTVAIGL
jgi:hypothetical protein